MSDALDGKRAIKLGKEEVQRRLADGSAYLDVVVKGHWIAIENEEMEVAGYYCSNCDLPMETEEKTDFCPNCGADMREGDVE